MPTRIKSSNITDDAVTASAIDTDAVGAPEIAEGAVSASEIASTFDISSKTVTLPAAAVTAHATDYDDNQLKEDIALLAFKQATSDSVVKYDLVDQSIDVFSDASGVNASSSTNEIRNTSGKYYSSPGSAQDATGGTVTQSGGYTYHSFPIGSTNFVAPASANIEVLMVAGGGAGGSHHGGGGGGGGIVYDTALAVTAQTYSMVVGEGGDAQGNNTNGENGENSTGFGWTAIGGGGGGHYSNVVGSTGGSGGGGGGYNSVGGATTQTSAGTGSSGTRTAYGYAGQTRSGANGTNGHGGGAGSSSGSPQAFGNFSSFGSSGSFSGGGGCGNDASGGGGGGAGAGSGGGSQQTGGAATNGTGSGGGGGGGSNGAGNSGGDGWIGIRYTTNGFPGVALDMTLVSNAVTAETQPTKADLVMTYTNGAGTATIGTDLTAEVTRDGANWTSFGLSASSDQGDTGGHTILTAHDIDISGQPAGSAMQYRIKTLNQSATKETRIHAVSLGWS